MRLIVLIVFAIILTSSAKSSPSENSIEWELRYPLTLFGAFRDADEAKTYFKNPDAIRRDWGYRRDLYVDDQCNGVDSPVLCSELKLGTDRLRRMRSMMSGGEHANPDNNTDVRDAFIATATGYNQDTGKYTNPSADKHRIQVRLTGEQWIGKTCQWSVDGYSAVEWKSGCREWLKTVSIRRGSSSSTISVKVLDSDFTTEISGESTRVKERLVLGLGDSFASGEGNPDIPVRLTNELDSSTSFPLPKRRMEGENTFSADAAQWLDRGCHRSLLGAQQRAMIAYAARHPREETTFLGFSCSGAQIFRGLIGPYSGTDETTSEIRFARKKDDDGKDKYWKTDMSQINRAILALCSNPITQDYVKKFDKEFSSRRKKKGSYYSNLTTADLDRILIDCPGGLNRKIDAVLLSIGGNDIGFSKAIGQVALQGVAWRVPAIASGQLQHPRDSRKLAEDELPLRYNLLGEALRKSFGITDAARIIIPQYPDPLEDGSGAVCGEKNDTNRNGLQALPERGTSEVTAFESELLRNDVLAPLNLAIDQNFPIHGKHWTVARSHVESFKKHGWCAEGIASAEDRLSVPLNPAEFNAYAETQRWFRSINDGFLVQNQLRVTQELTFVDWLFGLPEFLKVYGMFHPNGLGAASLADGYLKELEQVISD